MPPVQSPDMQPDFAGELNSAESAGVWPEAAEKIADDKMENRRRFTGEERRN